MGNLSHAHATAHSSIAVNYIPNQQQVSHDAFDLNYNSEPVSTRDYFNGRFEDLYNKIDRLEAENERLRSHTNSNSNTLDLRDSSFDMIHDSSRDVVYKLNSRSPGILNSGSGNDTFEYGSDPSQVNAILNGGAGIDTLSLKDLTTQETLDALSSAGYRFVLFEGGAFGLELDGRITRFESVEKISTKDGDFELSDPSQSEAFFNALKNNGIEIVDQRHRYYHNHYHSYYPHYHYQHPNYIHGTPNDDRINLPTLGLERITYAGAGNDLIDSAYQVSSDGAYLREKLYPGSGNDQIKLSDYKTEEVYYHFSEGGEDRIENFDPVTDKLIVDHVPSNLKPILVLEDQDVVVYFKNQETNEIDSERKITLVGLNQSINL